MFRTSINVDETTDVEQIVGQLKSDCLSAGIASDSVSLITYEVRETLLQLVERGRQLAQMGSQMTVTKKIAGDGYIVHLNFGAGVPKSFFQRIKHLILSK